jgi:hypothetical protein
MAKKNTLSGDYITRQELFELPVVKRAKTITSKIKNPPVNHAALLNSNVYRPVYMEEKQLNLASVLEQISNRANATTTPEGLSSYKIYLSNGKSISLTKNVSDVKSMFSSTNFLANYFLAFGNNFTSEELISNIFPDLKIKITSSFLANNNSPSISFDEISDFRFLTCLFFGIWFHIELKDCACYPSTIEDWIRHSHGLTKNCYNINCTQLISNKPQLFDPLVHTDCGDIKLINYVFNTLNIIGKNNRIIIDTSQEISTIEI